MTKEENTLNFADAYKQITEAENQASTLEKMLDQLDAKMNSIIQEAENINNVPENDVETEDVFENEENI